MKHFLDIHKTDATELRSMIDSAHAMKTARNGRPKGSPDDDTPLKGRMVALIFEKPSTRTRVSFDVGVRQMGGETMVLSGKEMQLGHGETIADTARVLSRMVDAIMIRTDDHAKIEELAHYASVPVINGLTDLSHPCQIMADLLTLVEHGLSLPGLELAWLGDGNNVLHSIVEAAGLMEFNVRIGVPEGYDCDQSFVERAQQQGAKITLHRDAQSAVAGAQVVVTDTWVSMGQTGAEARVAAMTPFQVNDALMAAAAPGALFLHCLPAHRGEEVTDSVIDGPQSVVWDEAENRIHAQKSVLRWVFGQL